MAFYRRNTHKKIFNSNFYSFFNSFNNSLILNLRNYSISTLKTNETINYLIIDGYSSEGREQLQSGGASTAGDLFVKMMKNATPSRTECTIVYPSDKDVVFPSLNKYDAVIWTGCSLTIHDKKDERVTKQIEFAKKCFEYGIPAFGSCWAQQIAVTASGGVCSRNPRGREMGISRKIQLSREGRSHPMFEGKSTTFDAFSSHEDETTHLSPSSLLLAGNYFTSMQAVAIRYLKGDFWAVQYHPEYDLHELARLIYCRRQKLIDLKFFLDLNKVDEYINDLETLHNLPERKDIAWKLGIDDDLLDSNIRQCEVRNFVKHLVLPYKKKKETLLSFA